MNRTARLTLALPVIILLAGLIIPAVVRTRGGDSLSTTGTIVARRAGRTADEWRALALESLDGGRLDRALREIKTAEAVDPGRQFAGETREIRSARRNARDVVRARERFLAADVEHIELDPCGAVLVGYRTTIVLPGESLWSLARQLVSADRGIRPDELAAADPALYRAWDRLTDLNGVRELDVGERVMVPLPEDERVAIATANAEDLCRIERGASALRGGGLEAAVALHAAVRGEFARANDAFRAYEAALLGAREEALAAEALLALGKARGLSRSSQHGEIIRLLEEARVALTEARALAGGTRHAEDRGRTEGLLAEAGSFRVEDDGSVVTTKPVGRPYTETALATVEWFLRRGLASSGREFPYVEEKTDDEIGWAHYLGDASEMARLDGLDFATLLESVGEEIEIRLPSPGRYFAE